MQSLITCRNIKMEILLIIPKYQVILRNMNSNTDENVKELRKRYDIPTNNSPKLLLKGKGNIKGSSVGDKTIEYTFEENKK